MTGWQPLFLKKSNSMAETNRVGGADIAALSAAVVLNHVSGHRAAVAGIYNRSPYEREVKSALAIWADHIASVTSGEERKILQFPAETGEQGGPRMKTALRVLAWAAVAAAIMWLPTRPTSFNARWVAIPAALPVGVLQLARKAAEKPVAVVWSC
jgi:hypothetical protein